MTPVIYDVILRNFNRVVKEKYGDKSVKVSELPWRAWWRECGARPVGQNNVAGLLSIHKDMLKPTIVYDELPFIDNTDGVTEIVIEVCSNLSINVLPIMTYATSFAFVAVEKDEEIDLGDLTEYMRKHHHFFNKKIKIIANNLKGDFILDDNFVGRIVIGYPLCAEANRFLLSRVYPNKIVAKNASIIFENEENIFNVCKTEIVCKEIDFLYNTIVCTTNAIRWVQAIKASKFIFRNYVVISRGLEGLFESLNDRQKIFLTRPLTGCDLRELVLRTDAMFEFFYYNKTIIPDHRYLFEAIEQATNIYGAKFTFDKDIDILKALEMKEAIRICGGF